MKRVAPLAGCPWWLPLLLLSLACSGIRVNHEYDSAADFSRYHSFAWKAGANLPPGSPIAPGSDLDLRFKHAIEGRLAAAGLHPAKDGKPDLYVAYYAYGSDTLDLTGVDYKLAPGVSWVGDPATHTERSYTEGTLEVDLVDAASNRLVWRARRRPASSRWPPCATGSNPRSSGSSAAIRLAAGDQPANANLGDRLDFPEGFLRFLASDGTDFAVFFEVRLSPTPKKFLL